MKSTKSVQIYHIVFLAMSIVYASENFCSEKNKFSLNQHNQMEKSDVSMLQELLKIDPSLQSIATSRHSPLLKMVMAEQIIKDKIKTEEIALQLAEEKKRNEEKIRSVKKAQAKAQSDARHFVKAKQDAMHQAAIKKDAMHEAAMRILENEHSGFYFSMLSRSNSLQSLRSPSSYSEYEADVMSVSNSTTGSMDSKVSSDIDPKIFHDVDTSDDIDKNTLYHKFNPFSASSPNEDK